MKQDIGEASDPSFLESCDRHPGPAEKSSPTDMDVSKNVRVLGNCNNEEINMLEAYEELSKARLIDHGTRRHASHKKSIKMAFCPKEIRKMLGSEELSLENAQSHTMRKILVFAPLGIRHGSEDMYELDFNHFSILHKNISPNSEQEKKASTKTKSKREAISKTKTSEKATTIHSEPSCSVPFGLMGYASSSPSPMTQAPVDLTKPVMANTASNIHYHNQCSYPVFPLYPPNSVVSLVYWPQPNAFAPFPYPSSYRYIAPGSYISVQPYASYYNHMSQNPLIPETLGTDETQNGGSDEAKRESNSSSSNTDSREK
ncbi:hypothetical protein K7X08_027023 [Anisodus acutangulus]|uniref:Uncharacterized protein n=1 Tax=Anisodus acutangulus TaxID=402998 RepID=A0A9Q1L9J9_9SOLA|nr:hypothetical protein K7X08_027023 [Anisodus acutangulus]